MRAAMDRPPGYRPGPLGSASSESLASDNGDGDPAAWAAMATPDAERMAALVAEHAPRLRRVGFRKRRHSFNRAESDGLMHVVYFWMAPKEPPAWTEVPGLRERRYGSFRIDLGVYVPEMTRSHVPRSDWINEYDCHLRRTIGQLLPGSGDDLWWKLDDAGASAAAGLVLEQFGLPWLAHFRNRQSVLDAFESSGGLPLGMGPAGALDIADLYRAVGRPEDERRTLERYVAQPALRTHAEYLTGYLEQRGHGDLAPMIQVRS
jgi:hypothetical protein